MKENYFHLTVVIDKSGSMYHSREDVIGGFNKLIDEQKANKDGKCTVSMYTFNDNVTEEFVGKDVNDVGELKYEPMGNTAMNDGIGTAIDKTGKWLSDMREEDRPGKVMVAIFTDGMENASKEYTLDAVKEKIKHQEEKYSWTFLYLGCDITTSKFADELGFKFKTYGSKRSFGKNYDVINAAVTAYRKAVSTGASASDASAVFSLTLNEEALKNTKDFEQERGISISTI